MQGHLWLPQLLGYQHSSVGQRQPIGPTLTASSPPQCHQRHGGTASPGLVGAGLPSRGDTATGDTAEPCGSYQSPSLIAAAWGERLRGAAGPAPVQQCHLPSTPRGQPGARPPAQPLCECPPRALRPCTAAGGPLCPGHPLQHGGRPAPGTCGVWWPVRLPAERGRCKAAPY